MILEDFKKTSPFLNDADKVQVSARMLELTELTSSINSQSTSINEMNDKILNIEYLKLKQKKWTFIK
jgi:hypothetical protein